MNPTSPGGVELYGSIWHGQETHVYSLQLLGLFFLNPYIYAAHLARPQRGGFYYPPWKEPRRGGALRIGNMTFSPRTANRNQKKSSCHKFVLQVATSFDDSLNTQTEKIRCTVNTTMMLTNSSTQIIQALIKILFAQNDTPTPPKCRAQKKGTVISCRSG